MIYDATVELDDGTELEVQVMAADRYQAEEMAIVQALNMAFDEEITCDLKGNSIQ